MLNQKLGHFKAMLSHHALCHLLLSVPEQFLCHSMHCPQMNSSCLSWWRRKTKLKRINIEILVRNTTPNESRSKDVGCLNTIAWHDVSEQLFVIVIIHSFSPIFYNRLFISTKNTTIKPEAHYLYEHTHYNIEEKTPNVKSVFPAIL